MPSTDIQDGDPGTSAPKSTAVNGYKGIKGSNNAACSNCPRLNVQYAASRLLFSSLSPQTCTASETAASVQIFIRTRLRSDNQCVNETVPIIGTMVRHPRPSPPALFNWMLSRVLYPSGDTFSLLLIARTGWNGKCLNAEERAEITRSLTTRALMAFSIWSVFKKARQIVNAANAGSGYFVPRCVIKFLWQIYSVERKILPFPSFEITRYYFLIFIS